MSVYIKTILVTTYLFIRVYFQQRFSRHPTHGNPLTGRNGYVKLLYHVVMTNIAMEHHLKMEVSSENHL